MKSKAKLIVRYFGVSLLGFVAGSVLGSLLFGFEHSLPSRLVGGAMSVFFAWLYPLGFAAAWPLFSLTLKMSVLVGVAVFPLTSTLWFIWKRRSYLAGVGFAAALLGLPNALIFAVVMSI